MRNIIYILFIFFSTACAEDKSSSDAAHIKNQPNNNADELITTRDFAQHYVALEKSLDGELNSIYKLLIQSLSESETKLLKQSQRVWIKYRDAEFLLIDQTFNRTNFGTSSIVSRGEYRTQLIKARVKQLQGYNEKLKPL